MPKKVVAQERSSAIRDLWIVTVVFAGAFAASDWIDQFDRLVALNAAYPRGHIDDLIAAATAGFFAFGWYAWRRWRSVKREADALLILNAEIEEMNRELAIAHEAAEAASRTKSQFLAAMSHELRTPLNAIIGFSALIREEDSQPGGNEAHREYADDIHTSGENLLRIVSDILDMSKLATGELALADDRIDVASTVHGAIRRIEEQAGEAELTVSVDLPADLPILVADEQRVNQMLVNLLSNAVKFTGPHGAVVVGAQLCTDGSLEIRVKDTGIGMDAEQIAAAIEPFQQVENTLSRKYEGAGLGLSLVQELIKRHGGRLKIASALGVGTSAAVVFPPTRLSSEFR